MYQTYREYTVFQWHIYCIRSALYKQSCPTSWVMPKVRNMHNNLKSTIIIIQLRTEGSISCYCTVVSCRTWQWHGHYGWSTQINIFTSTFGNNLCTHIHTHKVMQCTPQPQHAGNICCMNNTRAHLHVAHNTAEMLKAAMHTHTQIGSHAILLAVSS